MTEWLRKQAAPSVSSEVCESDPERAADYADLSGWLACAAVGNRSTGMEYMRRLDARSVASGQMSLEEFSDMWNTGPYEILALEANQLAAHSVFGGESATSGALTRYKTGTSVSNAADGSIRVDKGEVPEQ